MYFRPQSSNEPIYGCKIYMYAITNQTQLSILQRAQHGHCWLCVTLSMGGWVGQTIKNIFLTLVLFSRSVYACATVFKANNKEFRGSFLSLSISKALWSYSISTLPQKVMEYLESTMEILVFDIAICCKMSWYQPQTRIVSIMYVYLYLYLYMSMVINIYMYIHLYIYMFMCICMCVYMCVCIKYINIIIWWCALATGWICINSWQLWQC